MYHEDDETHECHYNPPSIIYATSHPTDLQYIPRARQRLQEGALLGGLLLPPRLEESVEGIEALLLGGGEKQGEPRPLRGALCAG